MSRRDVTIQQPEMLIFKTVTARPADTTTYKVDIPLGCYWLSFMINSASVDAVMTVELAPYTDAAQTKVATAWAPRLLDASTSADLGQLTVNEGTNSYAADINMASGLGMRAPVLVPFGAQLTVTPGDATTGTLEVVVVAARDA